MRIIISPAKQMGEERDFLTPAGRPIYEERAGELAAHLRSLPYGEMKKLLACSDALAQAAYEAYQAMDFSRADTPAILAYRGIQYQYMAPQVFEKAYFAYIQEHLRILSGLYGILRPLDAVVPYRLEMQAKVCFGPWRDLYHFWGDSLCRALTEEGGPGDFEPGLPGVQPGHRALADRGGCLDHLHLRGAAGGEVGGKGRLCEDGPGRDGAMDGGAFRGAAGGPEVL